MTVCSAVSASIPQPDVLCEAMLSGAEASARSLEVLNDVFGKVAIRATRSRSGLHVKSRLMQALTDSKANKRQQFQQCWQVSCNVAFNMTASLTSCAWQAPLRVAWSNHY